MSRKTKDTNHRTRADYPYLLSYRTRWSDNDQYSHVNNAVYYHLIDSIVNAYLAERCGCSPSNYYSSTSPNAGGQPIGLVVSSYCDFFSPISFPQRVVLGLRVVKLGRSSVSYEVGFFVEPENGTEIEKKNTTRDVEEESAKAVGGYTHVFVDRVHRRPVKEMNTTLKEGLQAILSDSSTISKL